MDQPPDQDSRRNQHQAKYLIALVPLPLHFATRLGVHLFEVRLGARINQGSNLPERRSLRIECLFPAVCPAPV